MAESWRCRRCWKVLSGKHLTVHIAVGDGIVVKTQPFVPPERKDDGQAQFNGMGEPKHLIRAMLSGEMAPDMQSTTPLLPRSGSASGPKRRQRGKKKKNNDNLPHYDAPAVPPPWNAASTLTKEVPDQLCCFSGNVCRDAIRDGSSPSHCLCGSHQGDAGQCQEVGGQVRNQEHLRKDMHRTTDTISQARKLLHQLQDAQVKHRKSWLKHLTTLMTTLGKQVEAFETQQKDYKDRIQKSRREIQIFPQESSAFEMCKPRKQRFPEVAIEDGRADRTPLQDAEEVELRSQDLQAVFSCYVPQGCHRDPVSQTTRTTWICLSKTLKRPRSREPGFGGATS